MLVYCVTVASFDDFLFRVTISSALNRVNFQKKGAMLLHLPPTDTRRDIFRITVYPRAARARFNLSSSVLADNIEGTLLVG